MVLVEYRPVRVYWQVTCETRALARTRDSRDGGCPREAPSPHRSRAARDRATPSRSARHARIFPPTNGCRSNSAAGSVFSAGRTAGTQSNAACLRECTLSIAVLLRCPPRCRAWRGCYRCCCCAMHRCFEEPSIVSVPSRLQTMTAAALRPGCLAASGAACLLSSCGRGCGRCDTVRPSTTSTLSAAGKSQTQR